MAASMSIRLLIKHEMSIALLPNTLTLSLLKRHAHRKHTKSLWPIVLEFFFHRNGTWNLINKINNYCESFRGKYFVGDDF